MSSNKRRFKDAVYGELARIGKAVASPKRLELLDLLCQGPRTVEALAGELSMSIANASQHLSTLRAKQVVTSRKEGNQVFYAVRDPLLIEVLDIMRRYFQAHVEEAMSMLKQIDLIDKDGAAK